MEQQHQLKHHGNYTIFEQAVMTAEERAWTVKRLAKEFKEKQERENKAMKSVPRPAKPSTPRRR